MSTISELKLGLFFTARRVTVLALSAATLMAGCSGGGDDDSGAAGGSVSGSVASCEIVQGSLHYCEEQVGSGATITGCSASTTGFTPGAGCPRDGVSGSCKQGVYTFYVYNTQSLANFCPGQTSVTGGGGSGGGGAVGGGGTGGSGGGGAVGGGNTSGSGGGGAVGGGNTSGSGGGGAVGGGTSEAIIACYIPEHGNFTGTSCTAGHYTASSCEFFGGTVFDTCPESDGFEGCCLWTGADAVERGSEQCYYDAPASESGTCGGTNGTWSATP